MLETILIFWIAPMIVAGMIWKSKGGGSGNGGLVGLLFSWLGVIFVAVATPGNVVKDRKNRMECPHCKELMRRDASVCPHCHRDVAVERFRSVTKPSPQTWEADGKTWVVGSDGRTYWLDKDRNEWVAVTSPLESDRSSGTPGTP